MVSLLDDFFAFEQNFDGIWLIKWTASHAELPILSVALYLLFIFTVPELLKTPFNLKTSFAMWNFTLSVFSIIGVSRTVPHLLGALKEHGFRYTVCQEPLKWYSTGPVALWMALFVYSKIPELLDTVFLVLRKKPVIFLHWFHHLTVLLYCWHAFESLVAPGLWFAAMNFSVHSVMYFYFFMTNIGFYKAVQPLAPLITTIQLLQMVGGIICLSYVGYIQVILGEYDLCTVSPANWKLGLMMYFSYFVLFAVLFIQKYLKPSKGKGGESKQKMPGCPTACPTPEESFFQPEQQATADLLAELASLDERKRMVESLLAQKKTGDKKDD